MSSIATTPVRDVTIERKFTGLIALSNPKYNLYKEHPDPAYAKALSDMDLRFARMQDHLTRYFDASHTAFDIAERSGFSAATLRYYEEIGLLPAAGRTPAGYRRYDDDPLDRLAFLRRGPAIDAGVEAQAVILAPGTLAESGRGQPQRGERQEIGGDGVAHRIGTKPGLPQGRDGSPSPSRQFFVPPKAVS